ncbi:MAG: hypothetical protein J6T57_00475 [Alphaproteobacteria bacterium]|nr:hypothetical protein [Alphaproteobacteria bacterium]
MNRKILWFCMVALVPCLAYAATRGSDAGSGRVGIRGASMASMSPANKVQSLSKVKVSKAKVETNVVAEEPEPEPDEPEPVAENVPEKTTLDATECREQYRECMDEFCQLDESEGGRCSCSDNIKQSKSLIQEIQKIQQEAETLYTEGVEKERLGAKAKFVKFGESDKAKKSSRASGIDLIAWINGSASESLAADDDIGDNLYAMAADTCEYILAQCDKNRAEMEEKVYQREVVKDCKAFDTYLAEQKSGAESNKRTAQAAVRSATLDMLGTTNKYNRGECLLAYRACIADKGGCGVNFENCLDADLLARRANACENVLDQCMAVKTYVLEDWAAESKSVLADAAVYSDKNMRLTCLAQIQACLEDGCATSTNSACLTNVKVAAGVCPIITECEQKIPGIQSAINDKLAELRTRFCQNDVDTCLRDKCGANFTGPQCLGKRTSEITELCPQDMFASCKNEEFFDVIVSSVLLQMDYQMVEGCKNYFADTLGRVCGTDMNCLPKSNIVEGLTKSPSDIGELRDQVRTESKDAVTEFFKQFDNEKTIAACKSATQPAGRRSLKDSVFITAKMIAEIGAENRYLADLESRLLQLKRADARASSRDVCLSTYKVENKPKTSEEDKSYSYIKSVSFEASLCNCHVCRLQRVCETGGESKAASALKAGAGGLAAGASAGTMINAGWGTAIGAVVGGVGAGVLGAMSGGEKDFCQEIESCEDIDVSDVEGGCRGEN